MGEQLSPLELERESRLGQAIQARDGISAARVLEEIGPCDWRKTFEHMRANSYYRPVQVFDKLDGSNETVRVSSLLPLPFNGVLVPVAEVTARRCDMK